jgi:outer membrane protein TolC
MNRAWCLAFLSAATSLAEIRTMTLKQVVDAASRQNPDLVLARLDRQKATEGVKIARDPFQPKVFGGSGAAYVSGFPMSIEGSAPAIWQMRTQMALFNRPLSYELAKANEEVRGADLNVMVKQEEVVYRVATLFLAAELAQRGAKMAEQQIASQNRVLEVVRQRVEEGRELAIEQRRAALDVKRAEQRAANLRVDQIAAESDLSVALGYEPGDQVRAAQEDRQPIAAPESEEEAINAALRSSRELQRLESSIQAQQLELRSYKARWLPTVNLVAQYAVLAERAYKDFFGRFQRNNWQLGGAVTVPLIVGKAASAFAAQSEIEILKLRTQLLQTRSRIAAETRKSLLEVEKAATARDLARADLDLTREQLGVYLAQLEEGRIPMVKVEELRVMENQKWIGYYDALRAYEQAKLLAARHSGTLMAIFK